MITVNTIQAWQAWRAALASDLSVGFVPTMGHLHAGHVQLIERARAENDVVLVSIFINPTQFNQAEDLANYPVTLEADLATCQQAGADCVALPQADQMYPDDYCYRVQHEGEWSSLMEGQSRPGHFNGMLTVVWKLLNLARADRAYFGEKDFQQLQLVKGMVESFFIPTDIIGCPTVREASGLAMSSRNSRLSDAEKQQAPRLSYHLRQSLSDDDVARALQEEGFEVEYVKTFKGRRYGAVKLGAVRLIDNIETEQGREC